MKVEACKKKLPLAKKHDGPCGKLIGHILSWWHIPAHFIISCAINNAKWFVLHSVEIHLSIFWLVKSNCGVCYQVAEQ